MKSASIVSLPAMIFVVGLLVSAAPAETVLINRQSDLWRYFKGVREPSEGSWAWTQTDYDDDEWLTGQTPIGYGYGNVNTPLTNMVGNYTTVYLRHSFTVNNPAAVDYLELRMYYDDGFAVYINGDLAWNWNVDSPPLSYDAVANTHEALEYENFALSPFLVAGENTIAIHAVNDRVMSSDFIIDAELVAIPEPTTLLLLGLGGLMLRRKR